jgi:hypothetical protein
MCAAARLQQVGPPTTWHAMGQALARKHRERSPANEACSCMQRHTLAALVLLIQCLRACCLSASKAFVASAKLNSSLSPGISHSSPPTEACPFGGMLFGSLQNHIQQVRYAQTPAN